MTTNDFVHAQSNRIVWETLGQRSVGNVFNGVKARQLICLLPQAWQVELAARQTLPPHTFSGPIIHLFTNVTNGFVSIDNETVCRSGTVRWCASERNSDAWQASAPNNFFFTTRLS